MNNKKLKLAEQLFLSHHPDGFNSPEMLLIGNKHKMDKYIEFAQENFTENKLNNIEESAENMIKMVTKSSMVSVFEKPKFRDCVRSMTLEEKTRMVTGLKEMLHGDEEQGFNMLLSVLLQYKLGKWTLMTVFVCYYKPQTNLLFKPTTVKNIINYFEIDNLVYKPKPTYEFFRLYRDEINSMKSKVNPILAPNNAAFSGFLMMVMDEAM